MCGERCDSEIKLAQRVLSRSYWEIAALGSCIRTESFARAEGEECFFQPGGRRGGPFARMEAEIIRRNSYAFVKIKVNFSVTNKDSRNGKMTCI